MRRPWGGYQEISAANNNVNVLPGEYIDLKLSVTPTPMNAPTGFAWKLSNVTFRKYEAGDKGKLYTDINTSSDSVQFCWADTGTDLFADTRTTSVTAMIGDVKISGSADLGMNRPLITYTAKMGKMGIGYAVGKPPELTLLTPDGNKNGIDFQAQVKVPPNIGFSEGNWYFGQLIDPNASYIDLNKKVHSLKQNGNWVMDTQWPYDPVNNTPDQNTTGDSPGIDLDNTAFSEFRYAASFKMYLMFKPSGDNSQYVPLEYCQWAIDATAKWDATANKWGFQNGFADPDSHILVTSTHPEWDAVIDPDDFD